MVHSKTSLSCCVPGLLPVLAASKQQQSSWLRGYERRNRSCIQRYRAVDRCRVIFAHCPALRMSPLLQDFQNLFGLEIFNSTIVEWPASAGIVQKRHLAISCLVISRSSFTTFPDGLRGPLPETLFDIEISTTNLSSLPRDLHKRWNGVTTLYVEYSNLSLLQFPLEKLQVKDLSFMGNSLTSSLDTPESGECSQLLILSLGNNPLQSLPTHGFCDPTGVYWLGIEQTKITTLPSWTMSVNYVCATNTPLCNSQSEGKSQEEGQGGLILCEDPTVGRFPLDYVTSRRRITT